MPNHVTTEITGTTAIATALTRKHTEAERLEHDAAEIERKQRFADRGISERYTYMPMDMNEVFIDFAMLVPQPANIETDGCSGQHEDGVVCWYSWNIENWGTKWNGYDLEVQHHDDAVTLRFDTAWSHPFPIIEALSEKFPDAELSVRYADEDLGHNLGEYTITGGEVIWATGVEEGTPAAVDYACRLKYNQSYAEMRAEWDED